MNNEERILSLLEKVILEISEIKSIQTSHTKKLNSIEEVTRISTEHSANISDRVLELERKVLGI